MLQLAAGFVEDFAERHRDQFQMGGQALEFSRGQGGKKMVLIRIMRCGHWKPPFRASPGSLQIRCGQTEYRIVPPSSKDQASSHGPRDFKSIRQTRRVNGLGR